MPDSIREMVEIGVEVAKTGPKITPVDKKLEVEQLSNDPDKAREQWEKPWE